MVTGTNENVRGVWREPHACGGACDESSNGGMGRGGDGGWEHVWRDRLKLLCAWDDSMRRAELTGKGADGKEWVHPMDALRKK